MGKNKKRKEAETSFESPSTSLAVTGELISQSAMATGYTPQQGQYGECGQYGQSPCMPLYNTPNPNVLQTP